MSGGPLAPRDGPPPGALAVPETSPLGQILDFLARGAAAVARGMVEAQRARAAEATRRYGDLSDDEARERLAWAFALARRALYHPPVVDRFNRGEFYFRAVQAIGQLVDGVIPTDVLPLEAGLPTRFTDVGPALVRRRLLSVSAIAARSLTTAGSTAVPWVRVDVLKTALVSIADAAESGF